MLVRIATCAFAFVATLVTLSQGSAYATGQRMHKPVIHAGAQSFEPPDPCKGRCGGASRYHR